MIWIIGGLLVFALTIIAVQVLVIRDLNKSNEQLTFQHNEDDEMFDCLREMIGDDLSKFLGSMTRDELAAYQGRKTVPEKLDEVVRVILSEWHQMRISWIDAEARANAAAVRDLQHPALQEANKELVEIIAGVRNRLATSADSPFGVYTGRFPTFSRLCLFLIDRALAQAPPESLSRLEQDIAKGLKGAL